MAALDAESVTLADAAPEALAAAQVRRYLVTVAQVARATQVLPHMYGGVFMIR